MVPVRAGPPALMPWRVEADSCASPARHPARQRCASPIGGRLPTLRQSAPRLSSFFGLLGAASGCFGSRKLAAAGKSTMNKYLRSVERLNIIQKVCMMLFMLIAGLVGVPTGTDDNVGPRPRKGWRPPECQEWSA